MKKSPLYLAAVAALALLASCNEKEPTPVEPAEDTVELKAPVLSAAPTDVTLSEDNLDSDALKLSWTSAVPEGEDVTVIYSIYANLTTRDMYKSPMIYSAGGQLEFTFKGDEINSLVEELGAEVGTDVELQFSVYAKSDDDDIESVVSNIVKVNTSTYKAEIVVPETLWIAGSATDAGWDISKGIAMPKGSDGVYRAENVNLNVTISDTGFKIYFANDGSSDLFFGPDRSSEVFGTAMLYTEDDGSANLFQPAMNGYTSGKYTITLDVNALKMTLNRTGDMDTDVEFGENVYPLGGCFTWSWSFESPMAKVSDKVYEIENVKCSWGDLGNSGFKIFLADGKWSPYFAMTENSTKDNIGIRLVSDSDVPQFYPGELGYEDGYYTIRADFNTMTLTLTEGENPDPGDDFDENAAMYVLGSGFTKYGDAWSGARERALIPQGDGTYVSESDIYLNKWCCFQFATGDWSKQYVRDEAASSDKYWTLRTKEDGVHEQGFIPGNFNSDWADGYYKIVVDENNMTVTCTSTSTVDQSKAFYLYGEFKGSYDDWDFDDDLALMPTAANSNIYVTVKPVTLAEWSYFKFEKRDWTEYVRDQTTAEYWKVTARTHEPDNDKGFSPGDTGLKTGSYNVTLNLDNMTVTLTAAE